MAPETRTAPVDAEAVKEAHRGEPAERSEQVGGWAMVPRWIARSGVSSRAIHLFVELALCRNAETGKCNPGLDYLGTRLGCKKDALIAAMKELRLVGAVERKRGHGAGNATNSYRLHFDPPPQSRLGQSLDEPAESQSRLGQSSKVGWSRHELEEGTRKTMRRVAGAAAEPVLFSRLVEGLDLRGPNRLFVLDVWCEHPERVDALIADTLARADENPAGLLVRRLQHDDHLLDEFDEFDDF